MLRMGRDKKAVKIRRIRSIRVPFRLAAAELPA